MVLLEGTGLSRIPQPNERLFRQSLISGLLVCSLALLVTLPRAATGPQESDGAELVVAAIHGSLAHPPGYPIYLTILGWILNLIPGEPYLVASRVSCIMQSIAAGALAFFGVSITGSFAVGIIASLAWATFLPNLLIATDAEVFALGNLINVLFVGLILTRYRDRELKIIESLFLSLLFGIAVSHHQTAILWFPLILSAVLSREASINESHMRARKVIASILGFFLGLTSYLLIFARFSHAPDLAFGPVRSWSEFFVYILRLGYGTFSIARSSGEALSAALPHYLYYALTSISLLVLILLPLIYVAFQKRSAIPLGLFLSFALQFTFLYILKVRDIWHLDEWLMRFYSGASLAGVFSLLYVFSTIQSTAITRMFVALGLIIPTITSLTESLIRSDRRMKNEISEELNEILSSSPQGAFYFASSDKIAFGLRFEQLVHSHRTDLLVIETGHLPSPYYREILSHRDKRLLSVDLDKIGSAELLRNFACSEKFPVVIEPRIDLTPCSR